MIRVVRTVAEDSADVTPKASITITASAPILTWGPTAFTGHFPPDADPSYCCGDCEDLTNRIGQARAAGDEALLADLARELVELEARHRR